MSANSKIRFAVIGAGAIAPAHIKAIAANSNAELVAIADSVEDKAKARAQEYGIPYAYKDYQEMLQREDIHAVSISLPSGMHADAVIAAAQAGKHVLCEKPLEITKLKMDRMIRECRERNVKLAVVYQRRTHPAAIMARQAIQEGKLGKLVLGDVYMKYYRSPEYYKSAGWRGTWALDGGGALMNQGVHGIDLLQWMMGDVASVFAYSAALVRDIEVEDTAVAVVKYKNGAFGVIQGATSVYPEMETRFELHGEKGSITIGNAGIHKWSFLDDEKGSSIPPIVIPGNMEAAAISEDGHEILVDDLIHAIWEDRDPLVTGEEARKAVEIILAIYESSQLGKEIFL
jgi:UDP-N-acetyl-2-amino-2-deoxyglucuronate dehydrogenase